MSNQRSFILFIAFIVIVSYLYYESFLKKQDQSDSLHLDRSSNLKSFQVLNKRNLLSYSTNDQIEDFPQIAINEQASDHINQNTTNSKKRLKRETHTEKELLNWKFNVNITRLDQESKKLLGSRQSVPKSKKSGKEPSLNVAVYVEGEELKNSNTEFQRAWSAVGEFLRNFFGSTPEQLKENHNVLVEGSDFLDQLAKANKINKIQEGENPTVKIKEPKFLTSIFFPPSNGGENNENPPLELGSGEIQNLSFNSSSASSDEIGGTTDKEFSSMRNLEEPFVHEIATRLSSDLDSSETSFSSLNEIGENLTSGPKFPTTDEILETKSTESKNSNKKLDTLFKVVTVTELSEEKDSLNDLENFCINLLRNVLKFPKFLEEFSESEGSGSFNGENSENSELNVMSEVTTLKMSSPEPQLNRFQSLWNRIFRFRLQNEQRAAKMLDTFTDMPSQNIDLEDIQNRFFLSGLINGLGSGGRLNGETDEINFLENTNKTLQGFSIEDCKDAFLIKKAIDITTKDTSTENVMIPEMTFSSFKTKDFLSDNQVKNIDTSSRDNTNLTNVVKRESNDLKDAKISTESQFPDDSIAELDEKIQEMINSVGKVDTFETQITVISVLEATKDPDTEVLFSKPINKETVSNENSILEVSTAITQSFMKESNEPDVQISENTLLNNINENKVVSELYTYDDSYVRKNEFKDTDLLPESTTISLSEHNQRIFPGLFGSGSREITDEFSTPDINVNTNISFELFDLGSGERKIEEIHPFTNNDSDITSELSNFDFNKELNETFSQIDALKLSTVHNIEASNVEITSKNLSVQETEINGTVLRILDTGDGKEISIQTNSNQNKFDCVNCSINETPIPVGCTNCEETNKSNTITRRENIDTHIMEDSSKPETYVNPENKISVHSTINNIHPSNQINEFAQINETCSNCNSLTVETSVEYVLPQDQNKITSSETKEIKENESTFSTTKLEVFSPNSDSKEIDVLKISSNEANDTEDHKINLNTLEINEFNKSRKEFARNNDVYSSTPMLSRRGARAHNLLPPNWPDILEFILENSSTIHQLNVFTHSITEKTSTFNIPVEFPQSQDTTTTVTTSSAVDIADDTETNTSLGFNFTDFASTSETLQTDLTVDINATKQSQVPHNVSTAVSTSETVTKSNLGINPRAKIPVKKFCVSARECNNTLNERCISNNGITTCNCGRSFKRHPESNKCEATITLKTSLKLPGENFHNDLRDRSSDLFRRKEEQSLETMWILLGHDPDLFLTVAEISVDRFDDGSLVVNWDIKLVTVGNETVSELAHQIDEDLKDVLGNLDSSKRLPLNVQNASVSTHVVNPCEKKELNYCHKSAECILDEAVGFRCKCNIGYLDNSNDKSYPGEVCIELCYPNECGDHGECKLKFNGEKHCLCSGWFFGEKCEISGIVVIASFAGANIVVLLVLFIAVCICRKRRNRSYHSRNVTRFQPGQDFENSALRSQRVADAIALNEVGPSKVSKYVNISTPIFEQGPVIQVTSPSFTGSSIDYDSTFDRSPCSEENSRRESVTASKC